MTFSLKGVLQESLLQRRNFSKHGPSKIFAERFPTRRPAVQPIRCTSDNIVPYEGSSKGKNPTATSISKYVESINDEYSNRDIKPPLSTCFALHMVNKSLADLEAMHNDQDDVKAFAAKLSLRHESLKNLTAYFFAVCSHYLENGEPEKVQDFRASLSRKLVDGNIKVPSLETALGCITLICDTSTANPSKKEETTVLLNTLKFLNVMKEKRKFRREVEASPHLEKQLNVTQAKLGQVRKKISASLETPQLHAKPILPDSSTT